MRVTPEELEVGQDVYIRVIWRHGHELAHCLGKPANMANWLVFHVGKHPLCVPSVNPDSCDKLLVITVCPLNIDALAFPLLLHLFNVTLQVAKHILLRHFDGCQ